MDQTWSVAAGAGDSDRDLASNGDPGPLAIILKEEASLANNHLKTTCWNNLEEENNSIKLG